MIIKSLSNKELKVDKGKGDVSEYNVESLSFV